MTIRAFDEKWRHQKQAIDTAKNELHTLEKQVSNFNTWKSKLSHELDEEVKKSKGLEQRLKEKDNDIAVEASVILYLNGCHSNKMNIDQKHVIHVCFWYCCVCAALLSVPLM